jgi:RimJ/RimL family protein N-acetyltransferase
VLAAWRGDRVAGVAALRPGAVFDASAGPEVVAAFAPAFESLGPALVKSSLPAVDALWSRLSRRCRRRALLDRRETAYALRPGRLVEPPGGARAAVRRATPQDLEALVVAARESLREEQRPDPFIGDVEAFRRWVEGRVSHARVVEAEGRIAFTGYADVRRREGWLIQGVYTWPQMRRRGLATAGVSGLCREAFAAGADHVQLTVVDGNQAGQRLYEGLGFEAFAVLRTILFA